MLRTLVCAALVLCLLVPMLGAYAEAVTVYTSDFSKNEDGWYGRGAVCARTAEGTLRTTGRSSDWNSPGRDFDLVEGGVYRISAEVRQDTMDNVGFMISIAHSADGAESYENLASAVAKKGEWATLSGTYTAGAFDRSVLYVETVAGAAPTLEYEIRNFTVTAPDGVPEVKPTEPPMVIGAADNLPSLKEIYADPFDFGTAVPQFAFMMPQLKQLILDQFSILTPENEMKPNSVLDVSASQKLVKDNPKWLIGFSDITTLHAMETKAGVMSIHGTMSSFIAKTGGTDDNSTLVRDLLKGTVPTYKVPKHKLNQTGKAEGILVGGNMATFVPLVGASDIDVFSNDGIILFMEEVGESFHNIDRMFNSLELHGVMENVKGVILGEFVESESDMDLKFETAEELLSKYLKKYNIPVICGFPAGHDDVNVPIVMGAKVEMDVTADGATLAFDMDGERKTVDTDKLTNEPKLSKTARKMLAGKIFSIEE